MGQLISRIGGSLRSLVSAMFFPISLLVRGSVGIFSLSCIPGHIQVCDMCSDFIFP